MIGSALEIAAETDSANLQEATSYSSECFVTENYHLLHMVVNSAGFC